LCLDQRLYLDLARKQPLPWWQKNGVTEGIAMTFCNFTRAFKAAKEKGWTLPQSDDSEPIDQRFVEWYTNVRRLLMGLSILYVDNNSMTIIINNK